MSDPCASRLGYVLAASDEDAPVVADRTLNRQTKEVPLSFCGAALSSSILTTGQILRLLALTEVEVDRAVREGHLRCTQSRHGQREFALTDVQRHLGIGRMTLSEARDAFEAALRVDDSSRCVAILVSLSSQGLSLAQAFDEVSLPALSRLEGGASPAVLSFIDRAQPLGEDRRRGPRPYRAAVLAALESFRPREAIRMAACLVRASGFDTPPLPAGTGRQLAHAADTRSVRLALVFASAFIDPFLQTVLRDVAAALRGRTGRCVTFGARADARIEMIEQASSLAQLAGILAKEPAGELEGPDDVVR